MQSIIDHWFNDYAVPKEQSWTIMPFGSKKQKITTAGCNLCVQWKDGTTSRDTFKDLKQSNPVETAEYACLHQIDDQPMFAWWVNYVLKKRDSIVMKIKNRRTKKNMKFGIVVPSTVEEALVLDKANRNNHWEKALEKEYSRVRISFKLLEDGENIMPGYKKIPYHVIFDVKFDLSRKARLVAGGHKHRDVPSYTTHSSVVSCDSV